MSTVGPDVLGEIKEKNMAHVYAPPPKALSWQGFPEPFVRDEKVCLLLVYGNSCSVTEMNYYVSSMDVVKQKFSISVLSFFLKPEDQTGGYAGETFNYILKCFFACHM